MTATTEGTGFPHMRSLDTVTTKRARYVWAHKATGWVPLGALTLIQGMTGAGKSTFGSWLAAGISTGSLIGEFLGAPGDVLISSREEDPQTIVAPRLLAAGADLAKIYCADARDLDELQAEIEQCRPALVVVDPITSFISGDRNKTHVVRPVLERLNTLAQEVQCAIVAVTHPRKGNGSDTIQEASGSLEFANVPRSVITFAADGDDRRFSQVKNSLGPTAPTFSYNLREAEVLLDDGYRQAVPVFELLSESDGSVSDLLDNKRLTASELSDLNRSDRSMAIVRILGMNDRALSTSDVATAVGIEAKHASTYLARLAKGGEIVKIGRGSWASRAVARSAAHTASPPMESVESVGSVGFVGGGSTLATQSTVGDAHEPGTGDCVVIAPGIRRKPNGSLIFTLLEATQDELDESERQLQAELAAYRKSCAS